MVASSASETENVLLQRIQDGIAFVTLNRPERMNALEPRMMRELPEALRRLADNPEARCVILTGAGQSFCAGGDVRKMAGMARDIAEGAAEGKSKGRKLSTEARSAWLRRSAEASRLLYEMPKPTIAMINGACAGAGMSLAAACDFRFAAQSARFVPAFTASGMSGDYGGGWLWPRIIGSAKARQLLILGEPRNAGEALEFGLIDRLFPDEELEAATLEIARRLTELPPAGVAYAKANLNAAQMEGFAQFLDRESLHMTLSRNAMVELHRSKTSPQ